MDKRQLKALDTDLRQFLESMFDGLGRRERREALAAYATGLLLDGERKSMEPIAARLVDDPSETEAMRQRLQQAVSMANWAEGEVWHRLAVKLDVELPGVEALVIDDTGFPKKGHHSVGVTRQYSGTLGRIDNCQVATSLHLAGEQGSGCIGMRLYLPETWANDQTRRREVSVPDDVVFEKKWQIALDMIDDALAWGVRKHVVLADAGYGQCSEFREGLSRRGLSWVMGVQSNQIVWPLRADPKRLKDKDGRYRFVDEKHPPVSLGDLGEKLTAEGYTSLAWREGSRGVQRSYFRAERVRLAHGNFWGTPPDEECWLLIEWPKGAPSPTKYWLSNLPATTTIKALVRLAKLRWRVERDYQELKQEIGLDHFEGRTWRGFHHHVALCALAHGFLALRRALFPPEEAADLVDAAAASPAGAALPDRRLPDVPPEDHSGDSPSWPVTNVTASY